MVEKILEDYLGTLREVENLHDEIERLKRIYYPRTARLTGLPGAHNNADQSDGVVMYLEKNERYNAKAAELATLFDMAEDAITQLEDPEERLVLRMFYMQGYTIKAIAKKQRWSVSTCNRRKRSALYKLTQLDITI